MTRKYSSISTQTTLASAISSSATSITVAASTGTTLMGGQSLAVGFVDQFTLVIDPDTANEEVVFATAIASDTLTVVRGRAGTAGIAHSSGAIIKHVLTSDDLAYFTAGVDAAVTLTGTQTITGIKTLTTPVISTITNTGTITLPTSTDTLVGKATTDTFTNKTFDTAGTGNVFRVNGTAISANTGTGSNVLATTPTLTTPVIAAGTNTNSVFVAPQERLTISATAATGTVQFDASTQGVLYYTTNSSANWTLNVRGTSSVTLNTLLAIGDSITVAFMATNGATAYYASALNIDGVAVTPKYVGGTAYTSGNASAIDMYIYTIIKTASATWTVLVSQNKYA